MNCVAAACSRLPGRACTLPCVPNSDEKPLDMTTHVAGRLSAFPGVNEREAAPHIVVDVVGKVVDILHDDINTKYLREWIVALRCLFRHVLILAPATWRRPHGQKSSGSMVWSNT